jgi:hypothetical protein
VSISAGVAALSNATRPCRSCQVAGITGDSWYASRAPRVGYELIGAAMFMLAGGGKQRRSRLSEISDMVAGRREPPLVTRQFSDRGRVVRPARVPRAQSTRATTSPDKKPRGTERTTF